MPWCFIGLAVMTLALHARGPQFNPGMKYLFILEKISWPYYLTLRRECTALPHARLAQSVERKALNLVVVGSSPTVGTFSLPTMQLALKTLTK